MKQFLMMVGAVVLGGIILSVLSFLFFFVSLIVSAASASGTGVIVKDGSIVTIDLSKPFVDKANNDDPVATLRRLMYGEEAPQGINTLTEALAKVAEDDKVQALVLRGQGMNVDYAGLRAVRRAIADFKASCAKPVIYYDNNMSGSALYVASVADSVFIAPEGVVGIEGVTMQKFYLKGIADRFGIGFDIIKHGKYKSAIEPFAREDMSPEDREQSQRIVDVLWEEMRDSIAAGRGIDPKVIDEYVDSRAYIADRKAAVKVGLVDADIYWDEFKLKLRHILGKEATDKVPSCDIYDYATTIQTEAPSASDDHLAVVYATGEILDGKSDGTTQAIFGDDLTRQLNEIRGDSAVKAVVFRVNSPGGSAAASELIWREVKLMSKDKPIVVSMGGYAASGGYYISCPADYIFAEPTTLTGSIGVYGMVPNVEKLTTDAGVNFETVSSSKNPMVVGVKALKPEDVAQLVSSVEATYATFIGHVAEGRGMTTAQVDSIGQGRVWMGKDAVKLGLVNELGNVDDAIEMAMELAGTTLPVIEYPKPEDPMKVMLKSLGLDAKATVRSWVLGPEYSTIVKVKEQIDSKQGFKVMTRCDDMLMAR